MKTVRKTIMAKRVSGRTFRLTTPRLPKGRHTVRLTATDRAGNAQRLPSPVRLTIR